MDIHGMNKCRSFEVLFVCKKARRKPLEENKFVVNQGGLRSLCSPPLNKNFSICDGIQFNEANKALNSCLKHLASTGKIVGTIHSNPLTAEIIQKSFERGEFACADTKIPRAFPQTTWF